SGMAFIISSTVNSKEAPKRDDRNVGIAVSLAQKHLEWAARVELQERKENLTDQAIQTVAGFAAEKLLARMGPVGLVVSGGKLIADFLELAQWVGDTANIAAFARTEDEIDIAAQAIARRIVKEVVDAALAKVVKTTRKAAPAATGGPGAGGGRPRPGPQSCRPGGTGLRPPPPHRRPRRRPKRPPPRRA